MIDNAILSLIIGSSTAVILAFMRYSFLSKCNKIDCLCCKIHRNTNEELSDVKVEEQKTSN